MLTLPLSTLKKPLSLTQFDNPEDMLKSICEYTSIESIYCSISNPEDYASPHPTHALQVIEIGVPSSTAAFLKGKLTESLYKIDTEIKKYPLGDDDFETISSRLQRCVDVCKKAAGENIVLRQTRYLQAVL